MREPLGPRSPSPASHFSLPLCTPHSHRLASAGLLGLTLTLGWPPIPFPRGLVPQCWGLGTTKLQCQTHPVTRPPQVPIRAPQLIQDGRKRRALRGPSEFEGISCKILGSMPPLPSTLNLAHQSAHYTAFCSVLWASWVLTLTLGLEGPFSSGLVPQCWGLGTPNPQSQTHTATRQPHGTNGAPPLLQWERTGKEF